jgi:hypothetical protein
MDVCNAISAIILEVIGPMYLATLRLLYVGIGTRTPLQILVHLYRNYAKITPADLDNNDRAMKQPCGVNQPIEVLYQKIKDAIEFTAAGQTPYSPEQVLSIAYQLVFRTGIFSDDCKIWKCHAVAYKTWPQLKLNLAVAYQEYSEALDIALSAAGFNAEELAHQHDSTPPAPPEPPVRTHFAYAKVITITGQIYSDQTRRFPVTPSKGNKYIMVVSDYASAAILAKPIKNRTKSELLRAYYKMHQYLTDWGLKPQLQKLDNECSAALKQFMRKANVDFQLVSPYDHRQNAAERAIGI